MSHFSSPPPAAPRACGTHHGLHVIAGRSPSARASCRCGWWATVRGEAQVIRLATAHSAHRATCDGTAAQTEQAAA